MAVQITNDNQITAFYPIEPQDMIISTENVTSTVWENNQPTLTTMFTSSVQAASATGQFYYSVYGSEEATGSVQFAIAYCDADGSGSLLYNPNVDGLSPTRTNYGQYRNLILGDEETSFVFGNQSSSYFYALPIERAGYKEEILPGVWTLALSDGSGNNIYLTDDSKLGGAAVFSEAGRVYNIVTGSAGNVYTSVTQPQGWTVNSGSYGFLLPDIGVILLSGEALDGTVADSGINLQNSNYSTNPSFISGSDGAVLYNSFINDPQVYITTVGLYNNDQELVAVAKLSRPLLKDFTKELLVRIKLDF